MADARSMDHQSIRDALGYTSPLKREARARGREISSQRGSVAIVRSSSWLYTNPAKTGASLEGRFLSRVLKGDDGCWRWVGSVDRDGYGRFYVGRVDGKVKVVGAHRWSYENWVGPLGEGMVPDHTCRVRNCVNPQHFEQVTHAENVSRGWARKREERGTCVNGHAADTHYVSTGVCRQCQRQYSKDWRTTVISSAQGVDYRALRALKETERRERS